MEMSTSLDMNNYDIHGVDRIYAHGDSNTYIQFHVADEWRVVTGGSQRLEVNNSQITSTEPIHAPSFHGDGSSLTGVGGSTTYGAVGTYLWAGWYGAGIAEGNTILGSSLQPAGDTYFGTLANDSGQRLTYHARGSTALSGTWRAMGRAFQSGTNTNSRFTLFVRIS